MRIRGVMAVAVVLSLLGLAQAEPAPSPSPSPAATPTGAAPTPPGPRALPTIPHGGRTIVVRVDGAIDLGLAPFLSRVITATTDRDLLVLDINTLGGRIDAAIAIRDALLHAPARTVCWVHPRAISAGALISLACDVIAVADGSSIGAATPVELGADGAARPVAQKIVSYMRSEMRATATAKGRSGAIAEAMVDADADVPGLDDKRQLLTLDGAQALAWGVAELRADAEPALWHGLGVTPTRVERPGISWAERLARLLSDPTLAGLLMSLGMLGILIELFAGGGHGAALTAGLVCLGLFFFGHHLALLAGWEEILMFLVGAGLLAFEILVPGHIAPGVAGALLIVSSLVMAMVNLDSLPLGVAWRAGGLPQALATVGASLLLTALGAVAAIKLLPRTRLGRPLVLDAALRSGRDRRRPTAMVGQRGVASGELRPAGKASFAGVRCDVVLDSGHASDGATVEVVRVERDRVLVRAIVDDALGASADAPTAKEPS